MNTPLDKRNKSKYYHLHYYYGNNTKDYHDLKEKIEELIPWEVHLEAPKTFALTLRASGEIERQINIIISRPILGGDNSLGHKPYAQATIEKCPRFEEDLEIFFKKEET